ncbi:hypothetical protein VAE151_550369 [Vibrio aestuarianus]|uniref:Uncharacterized protein n=1 Tax=Vibrio aestuarianus TaxID=28171 RepID=A0ABN8TT54_9VIBR|nr:hypothetical protein VAE308_1050375 [Vibrio aestuarianus]CAH8195347.1 hypothetical protein VIBAE_A30968 [Vibrio aestuarianus subsp. francensis]CAH8195601.1 hypothetical protein VAE055_370370 [Vibrio aestuarianus]CAH8195749.1 hypothetical protein VAE032_270371 [Vibrio aestuarianus]CAH8195839.1 hypothetical protein VAE128_460374 [Vibrio aestuarianus]
MKMNSPTSALKPLLPTSYNYCHYQITTKYNAFNFILDNLLAVKNTTQKITLLRKFSRHNPVCTKRTNILCHNNSN